LGVGKKKKGFGEKVWGKGPLVQKKKKGVGVENPNPKNQQELFLGVVGVGRKNKNFSPHHVVPDDLKRVQRKQREGGKS